MKISSSPSVSRGRCHGQIFIWAIEVEQPRYSETSLREWWLSDWQCSLSIVLINLNPWHFFCKLRVSWQVLTKRNLVSQQSDGALPGDHLSTGLGADLKYKDRPRPKNQFQSHPRTPELRLSIEVSSQNTCKQNVQTKTEDKSNSETSGETILQVSVWCMHNISNSRDEHKYLQCNDITYNYNHETEKEIKYL